MGYSGAVGTMLMDEMAGICGRAEERFTGIRTDIGKLETELLKARDWSQKAQDHIDGLETHVRRLEASRRAMREDMDEMTRNMNGLLELNRQMIRDILHVETVSVSAIADHRHRYKLTGVTRYVCVSGPVRRTT